MAYSYQPYQSHPSSSQSSRHGLRPELPPVPPQLRAPTPGSGGPNGRPPLPPVPRDYLGQAAEQQRFDRQPLAQPRPQRAEAIIPAENLQYQADNAYPPSSYPSSPPAISFAYNAPASTAPLQPNHPIHQRYSVSESAPPIDPGRGGGYGQPQYPMASAGIPPRASTALPLAQSMGDLHLDTNRHHSQSLGPNSGPSMFRRTSMPETNDFGASIPPSFSGPTSPVGGPPGGPKALAQPVPDLAYLASRRDGAFANPDWSHRVKWSRQVLKFVERFQAESAAYSASGNATRISDPQLVKFTDEALKTVLASASSSRPVPEALYVRGDLSVTGSFPSYRPKDSKVAFRDFEASANSGFKAAWFRIGREYEVFGEWGRAVGAHERGMSAGDCASTYRLGMAYLLGQLELEADVVKAVAYLRSAADLADADTPQPAYIYGMLLAGEFESLPQIPADVLRPNLAEARSKIERAAYLGFAAAQYKMGWLHEYAQMGCQFDPLVSVEYYSLASKQGETEADMALSKWFLCGADGYFPANEGLAMTFAEKAARKHLPSAQFAVGYYLEVGINNRAPDLAAAEKWYARAASGGNTDAVERLEALRRGEGGVSKGEHQQHVEGKLVRKRTMAVEKSRREEMQRQDFVHPASSLPSPGGAMPQLGAPIFGGGGAALRRGETMRKVEEARVAAQRALTESKAQAQAQNLGQGQGQGQNRRPTLPQSMPSGPQRQNSNSNLGAPRPGRQASYDMGPPPLPSTQGSPGNRPGGYQLSDTPAPAAPRPAAPSSRPSISGASASSGNTGASVATANTGTTFNSFADMGIPTAKASSSNDCVIM